MPQSDWTHRFRGSLDTQYRHQNLIGCFMFQVWGRCGCTVQTPQSDWLLRVSGLGVCGCTVQTPQSDWLLRVHSGFGEVWTHSTDAAKFRQFGWRCTNKESSYSDNTLVGNWNEKRFDVKEQRKAKPLPSDVSTHAYTHKIVCWRRPLESWSPYIGEILDPPLITAEF